MRDETVRRELLFSGCDLMYECVCMDKRMVFYEVFAKE